MNKSNDQWTVIDLFSGAGGMSYGFHAHPRFRLLGAVDAQIGKPSAGKGRLECNSTYRANIGIDPLDMDLGKVAPEALREQFSKVLGKAGLTVLISCAPCTGFSRTLSHNHLQDDPRNSLVGRSALFVRELQPTIFLMENARELIQGNFSHHYDRLRRELEKLGYEVGGGNHFLTAFGLPQRRERALVVAVKRGLPLRVIEDLWTGYRVRPRATHVRRAISNLPPVDAGIAYPDDAMHVSPKFTPVGLRRLQLIPKDGGSWSDLRHHPEAEEVLTPAMKRYVAKKDFGSHPDVYGRLWWDKPAVTIKRECGHTGNGRYAHPEQDRLCTVREMAILQGFPRDFQFVSGGLTNMYRHIGDAVPPLISYQLARLCEWILSGRKPALTSLILKGTHLTRDDFERVECQKTFEYATLAD